MAPIRKGDGTGVAPKGIAEVRKGDGTVLYSAVSDIPDSGIARYTFDDDDTSGSTAVDVWGSNDGTISGATTGVSGANQTYTTNEAYSFDGTDDYVDISVIDADIVDPVTVALWVNVDTLSGGEYFFSHANRFLVSYEAFESSGFEASVYDNSYNTVTSNTSTTGSWLHFVAAVSSSSLEFYIDASSQGSISHSGIDPNDSGTFVGARDSGLSFADAQIDDVRVYDKQLTSTEVSNLYNNGEI
jgi:hypothetical protein